MRKGAADKVRLFNPMDPPMIDMIQKVRDNGCASHGVPPSRGSAATRRQTFTLTTWWCQGAPAMHELIKQGAATLCF